MGGRPVDGHLDLPHRQARRVGRVGRVGGGTGPARPQHRAGRGPGRARAATRATVTEQAVALHLHLGNHVGADRWPGPAAGGRACQAGLLDRSTTQPARAAGRWAARRLCWGSTTAAVAGMGGGRESVCRWQARPGRAIARAARLGAGGDRQAGRGVGRDRPFSLQAGHRGSRLGLVHVSASKVLRGPGRRKDPPTRARAPRAQLAGGLAGVGRASVPGVIWIYDFHPFPGLGGVLGRGPRRGPPVTGCPRSCPRRSPPPRSRSPSLTRWPATAPNPAARATARPGRACRLRGCPGRRQGLPAQDPVPAPFLRVNDFARS
jgi:hypothetical protein